MPSPGLRDSRPTPASVAQAVSQFATVELTAPPTAPSRLTSAITIRLHVPQGVKMTVTGLDADAATLLLCELVTAGSRPPALASVTTPLRPT